MSLDLFESPDLNGAHLSPCRTYRYALWRAWGDPKGSYAAFIGLNPSTADETADDPTIRRCKGFAQSWGCDGMLMLNLFAFRATDPKALLAAFYRGRDVIGPENEIHNLTALTIPCNPIVAAWGGLAGFGNKHLKCVARQRAYSVVEAFNSTRRLFAMGFTKTGDPRHPLYMPKGADLQQIFPSHNMR